MKKKLLLLIEDNPLLTGMYKIAFEKRGVELSIAHDGESGLKLAKDEKPDAILLDLLMPGMDGYEVLEKVRKDKEISDIKVVILTVLSDEEHKKKAKDLGANDYLVKSELELHEIVDKVIEHLKDK